MMARGGIPSDLGVRDSLPFWGEQVVPASAPARDVSSRSRGFSLNELLFVSLERTRNMRGLRCSIVLLLAAVWFAPLRAQESTGSIRGRITDQSSEAPLGGAAVRFGNQSTQT